MFRNLPITSGWLYFSKADKIDPLFRTLSDPSLVQFLLPKSGLDAMACAKCMHWMACLFIRHANAFCIRFLQIFLRYKYGG